MAGAPVQMILPAVSSRRFTARQRIMVKNAVGHKETVAAFHLNTLSTDVIAGANKLACHREPVQGGAAADDYGRELSPLIDTRPETG
jgi:hypothetical protein